MSVKYIYAGSEQTETSIRKKGPIEGLTVAADGTFSTSVVRILDKTGALDYAQLQDFAVEETTATPARLYTGRILGTKLSRGPFLTGAGRAWDFEVDDLNGLLHMEPLRGNAAKRPRESGSARLSYLLGAATGLAGKVWDNGLVGPNPALFDEADYRGRYPDEVLIDICASPLGGRIFFVRWDPTAPAGQEPSLFYDMSDAPVNTSTLSLSNVPAHCGAIDDPATTVYPVHFDPDLNNVGSFIYCGVYFTYKGVPIFRHNDATHAAFFGSSSLHRVGTVDTDRIGKLQTAQAHADLFLLQHNGQTQTVTCKVKLPASKVTLIEAGHRIAVEFEHFPGFDDPGFTWTRVSKWTLLPFDETSKYFDLQLDLSTKGIGAGMSGGGAGGAPDPGNFPHQGCVGAPVVVNQETTGGSSPFTRATWSFTPTAGNTLVFIAVNGGGYNNLAPAGWSRIQALHTVPAVFTDGVSVYVRDSDGTETGIQFNAAVPELIPDIGYVLEISGSSTADILSSGRTSGGAGVMTPPAVTPPTGVPTLLLGIFGRGNSGTRTIVPEAGYTIISDGSGTHAAPFWLFEKKAVLSPSGSYTPTATETGGWLDNWEAIAVALTCTGGSSLPDPGKWVYDSIPVPPPDGTTTTFSTIHPFADGSLKVKVDGTDQTGAIVSYDGGSGADTSGAGAATSDRGQRAVTLHTPAATVASPFGLTQINAARAAAGVGGIVRFPAATYAASPTMSVAGQKWELAPGADITGTVSITADGCTIQGGRVANIAVPRPSHAADTYTIADVVVYGTGNPILIEGAHDGGTITNCEFSGSSLDPIKMFIDTAPDGNVTGWDVLNNIISVNNDHSWCAANDGGGLNNVIGYRILNNIANTGGRQAGNGFGIEVWGGVNGEIGYNDLRGGGFLISPVRSQGLLIHHNLGTLSAAGAYAFCESGGSDMTACIWEYNVVNGDGSGTFIYHDANSHDHIVRFNQVTNVANFLEGSGGGGGYAITDNFFIDVTNWPPGVFTIPNTLARNGATYGTTGGTFTLAFAPRASELVQVSYQGR